MDLRTCDEGPSRTFGTHCTSTRWVSCAGPSGRRRSSRGWPDVSACRASSRSPGCRAPRNRAAGDLDGRTVRRRRDVAHGCHLDLDATAIRAPVRRGDSRRRRRYIVGLDDRRSRRPSPTDAEHARGSRGGDTTTRFVESILEPRPRQPTGARPSPIASGRRTATVVHPLIRTHPENGRRILFIGGPSTPDQGHATRRERRPPRLPAELRDRRAFSVPMAVGVQAIWRYGTNARPCTGPPPITSQVQHGPKDRDRRRPALLRSLERSDGQVRKRPDRWEKNDDSIQAAVGRARAGPQCNNAGRLAPPMRARAEGRRPGGHVEPGLRGDQGDAARLSPAEPCRRELRAVVESRPVRTSPPARLGGTEMGRSTTSRPLRRGYRTLRTATGRSLNRTPTARAGPDPAGRSTFSDGTPVNAAASHRQHRPLHAKRGANNELLVPKRGGGGVAETRRPWSSHSPRLVGVPGAPGIRTGMDRGADRRRGDQFVRSEPAVRGGESLRHRTNSCSRLAPTTGVELRT